MIERFQMPGHDPTAMYRRSMVEVADLYDINLPLTENKAFIDKVVSLREAFQEDLQAKMAANSVSNAVDEEPKLARED